MKKLFIILAFLAYSVKAMAQQNDDYKKMIDSAINIKYTAFKSTIRHNDSNSIENLYLINEQNQAMYYLSSSNKFKLINIYDKKSRKLISEGIFVWKIFTILNNNKLIVNIVDFFVTYRKRNYNFANNGGATVIFEYSCEEHVWKMTSSKIMGN